MLRQAQHEGDLANPHPEPVEGRGSTEAMEIEKVLKEFEKAGALLRGHFILTSGLRSDVYLQKSLIFTDAKRTTRLIKALAQKVRKELKTAPTAIVSTAIGAIVPGYEMGRQLG